jgi:hypothetical protein
MHQRSALSGFGGLGVSVLASGTQVRGFKPGRSRRIFKGGKIIITPSFADLRHVKDPSMYRGSRHLGKIEASFPRP